jgi:hypothetical protein
MEWMEAIMFILKEHPLHGWAKYVENKLKLTGHIYDCLEKIAPWCVIFKCNNNQRCGHMRWISMPFLFQKYIHSSV